MWTAISNFFGGLWGRIATIAAFLLFAVGAVVAVLLETYKKGESSGESTVKAAQQARSDETSHADAVVDSERPDFDAAVDKLRARSGATPAVQRPNPGKPAARGG